MAVTVVLMNGRPVADAPVDQAAAAGERDAAGADAAEREGEVLAARPSARSFPVFCNILNRPIAFSS
jgi:hypothetical protein